MEDHTIAAALWNLFWTGLLGGLAIGGLVGLALGRWVEARARRRLLDG